MAVSDLRNLRRRVDRARKFPVNTCPASRHLHLIAEALAAGMLSVLESLWKLRTKHPETNKTHGGGAA